MVDNTTHHCTTLVDTWPTSQHVETAQQHMCTNMSHNKVVTPTTLVNITSTHHDVDMTHTNKESTR